jgi:HAD superfamily phosphatase
MARPILVFDMDGVLVDVTESYRETICRTVEHFTGCAITREAIQDYKNQGGWNDDWKLSHHIVCQTCPNVEFQAVVDHFQRIFRGNGTDGLILRERWIAQKGLLERLNERFQLAVFTGRMRSEAQFTLERFCKLPFAPIVTTDEVARTKPAPDGLLMIKESRREVWYVGDTVDDARCARAAEVPFIGIAAPANPRHRELVGLFRQEQAVAVLDDINQLEAVLIP